jgi:hypothetical protein
LNNANNTRTRKVIIVGENEINLDRFRLKVMTISEEQALSEGNFWTRFDGESGHFILNLFMASQQVFMYRL